MVPGIVGPGTVTGGFSSAAPAGGDGTGAKIAQTEELLKQLSAFRFQVGKRFWHTRFWHRVSSLSESLHTLR
jgi:hypothetical protein